MQNAIALIASIDPALASAFAAQPANRMTMISAFHRSLAKSRMYGHLADSIAVALRSLVDAARA